MYAFIRVRFGIGICADWKDKKKKKSITFCTYSEKPDVLRAPVRILYIVQFNVLNFEKKKKNYESFLRLLSFSISSKASVPVYNPKRVKSVGKKFVKPLNFFVSLGI